MSKAAFAGLWVLVFVIPWELFITIPGFGTIGRVLGVLALGLGVIDLAVAGRPRLPRTFLAITVAFVVWSGATAFWSIDLEGTERRVQTYAQLTLLVWLIWQLAPSHERLRSLLQAYVLGTYLCILSTVLHYLQGTMVQTGRYAAEGFNPNDLGFTLVLAIPMAWYLALTQQNRLLKWVNRLYVPLGMVGVLLTASRGAFIPSLVALTIIPWTLPQLRPRTKLLFLVGLAASLVFIARFIPQTSWERLSTTSDEISSGDFSARGAFWKAGFDVFLQHPFFGVGAGTFDQAIEPAIGAARAPHQTFLSVLVGQGLIGLTLFLAMFAAAIIPLRWTGGVDRKFWIVVFLTLAIGLQPRTWEYRKPLWCILAIAAAFGAARPPIRGSAAPLRLLIADGATPRGSYSRHRRRPPRGRRAG